jgi:Uma2 family endonuclease
MVQAAPKTTTFDEFIAWLPERSAYRYELINGAIIEMPKPKGKHSEIAGFISGKLFKEIERTELPYSIPRECIVKSADGKSGFEPDVIVLAKQSLNDEPRWEQESILTLGNSIPLVVEVVSTNWQDDYVVKQLAYEALGISEYWIVDYLGLGGRRFIGNPKQPTISICRLVEGEYDVEYFRADEMLRSPTFPELELNTSQIFGL